MGSVGKGLRPLLTSKSFNIFHSLTPVVVVDPNVVSNHYHPLNRRVLGRIRAAETNEPRLIITTLATKKLVSKNSVVRSKAVRRVREAVYEILRAKGYGKEGELLSSAEKYAANCRERLVGTLSFSVTMDSVVTAWSALKGEVEAAIDKFIAISQKAKGTQIKSTQRTRFGLERGPNFRSGRPESSIEKVRSGLKYGKSLGGKSERGTTVAEPDWQGTYTAGGNWARRPARALTGGQGLQQRTGSEINGHGGRSEAITLIAEKPYQNNLQRQGGEADWPTAELRSQRSHQRSPNGNQGREEPSTGVGKGKWRDMFPKRYPQGFGGGPRFT